MPTSNFIPLLYKTFILIIGQLETLPYTSFTVTLQWVFYFTLDVHSPAWPV